MYEVSFKIDQGKKLRGRLAILPPTPLLRESAGLNCYRNNVFTI